MAALNGAANSNVCVSLALAAKPRTAMLASGRDAVMSERDAKARVNPRSMFGNLLVAGKTMAQSFLANYATRLHPIEWS